MDSGFRPLDGPGMTSWWEAAEKNPDGYSVRATSSTSKHSMTSPCWMFS